MANILPRDLPAAGTVPATAALIIDDGVTVRKATAAQIGAAAGVAATVGVGTVSTVGPGSPATVTNSGTTTAAVLNFGIPQGTPGGIGPTGQPGYKSFSTWALLNATTGAANDAAKVEGIDAGSHTDPVVGGTVLNVGRYAWSTSPAGWKRIADLTSTEQTYINQVTVPDVNSGYSLPIHTFATPNRSEGGVASSIGWGIHFSYGPYAANTLYAGQPQFTDNVFGIGWNSTGNFTPANPNFATPTTRIESRFQAPSRNPATPGAYCDGSEFHTQSIYTIGAGAQEVRAFSCFAPWKLADCIYNLDQTFRAAVTAWMDGNGDVQVSHNWAGVGGDKIIDYSTGILLQHRGNNRPWLRQLNAAGTQLLAIAYIDNNDHLAMGRGVEHDISEWHLNNAGINSAYTITAQNTPNGSRLRYLSFNGTSLATITDVETQGSASSALNWNLENTHASGAARLDIASGGGAALVRFTNNTTFTSGDLSFDGARVKSSRPFALPTSTVAGLPTAASVGAGARAFVSDATTPAFMATVAGGGAVFTPVYSDGSAWKVG